MGRILNKDEFKASLRFAAAEAEASKNMKEDPVEKPKAEEKPKERKKPGPKPKNTTKAAKPAGTTKTAKTTKTTKETKATKAEPVAAEQKKSKKEKQREALQMAISIMTDRTDQIIMQSDKLSNLAGIYKGYIETLEEMTE